MKFLLKKKHKAVTDHSEVEHRFFILYHRRRLILTPIEISLRDWALTCERASTSTIFDTVLHWHFMPTQRCRVGIIPP
jgi:hypothetical protein